MVADTAQTVRSAYGAIGLGVGAPMLRLFGQGAGSRAHWSVVDLVSGLRSAARDVAAEDLFGSIPGHWEVTRVEAGRSREGEGRVVVTGHVSCRPRGARSYDPCRVPFAHVWTLHDGEAVRVVSYLDGIELRRD